MLNYSKTERDKWGDMVQKIVDALVNKQSQNYVMTDEDEKIYRYGYILLCEVFLNLVIALAIGIAFSKTKEVIFFLGMYIPKIPYQLYICQPMFSPKSSIISL